MSRQPPERVADVLTGVGFHVYQALGYGGKPGAWHAHVSGLRFGDLVGLRMRSASITAEGIAYMIERDVTKRIECNGIDAPRLALREVLDRRQSTFAIRPNGSGDWCDVGYCSTESEARDRACAVVGHVFGRRLAERLRPYTPPERTIPSPREVAFA